MTPSEAVDLIKQKFYQRTQRRDLQPREVENAVSNVFNSSINYPQRSLKFSEQPVFRKITPNSYWNTKIPFTIEEGKYFSNLSSYINHTLDSY